MTTTKTALKTRKTKPARAKDMNMSLARATKVSQPQRTSDAIPSEVTGECSSSTIIAREIDIHDDTNTHPADAGAKSIEAALSAPTLTATHKPTKLALLIALLNREDGATLPELITATGWQAHSVRGALAGTLKHKGFTITSAKVDGTRHYRITAAA